jgi:hypothetical protein
MKPYHFYVAFNPLFNEDQKWKTQAHEFYHRLKEKKKINLSSYMYWGKIQVSQYSEPLNTKSFSDVLNENNDLQMETHLYITDYQHLWVGKVIEVNESIQDPENTLNFYKDKKVEVWFKLTDFELISNNAHETLNFLLDFHVDNEHYAFKIKEMTPFTSAIRFPMIIQDKSRSRYFSSMDLLDFNVLKDNPLIQEEGEGMKLNSFINSFVIPEENFKKMPEVVRSQITHAEILLVEAQSTGKKDRVKLEQAILTYLKCLEILLNETFVAHLKKEEGHRIWVTKDNLSPKFMRSALDKDKSSLVRIKDSDGLFQLSQLKMLLDTPAFFPHTSLDYIFRHKKLFWEFCRLELRSTLKNESLIELRHQLATQSAQKLHDRELLLVRNILLGIGGKGVLNSIVESWYAEDVNIKKIA